MHAVCMWGCMCGGVGVFVSLHVCVSGCMLRSYIPYLNVQDRANQIGAIENSFKQAKQLVSCCTCEAGYLLAQGSEGGRGWLCQRLFLPVL